MSDHKLTLQIEITLPASIATSDPVLKNLRANSPMKNLTVYSLILGMAAPWQAFAGDLPQICQGSDCGGKPFIEFGNVEVPNLAGGTVAGTVMDINQYSEKALLNWKSFDIGVNETVNFNQVSDSAVALNRIHDHDTSE